MNPHFMNNDSYTQNMEALFQERTSKLKSFYCREDIEQALNAVKRAPKDAVVFRMHNLAEICKERGVDADALLKNPRLLQDIPTRAEMQDDLLEILHDLYTKVPGPADFMERIVRRLAPEYKDDPVRVAILKKFITGAGFEWKAIKTSAIFDWAAGRMSPGELAHYDTLPQDKKLRIIVGHLDDSIFSDERLNVKPHWTETLNLMIKRVNSLAENYEIVDKDGNPCEFHDFLIGEETRAELNSFCDRHKLPYKSNDRIIDILGKAAALGAGENLAEDPFFKMLEKDFSAQMRTTFYIRRDGKPDMAAKLYKTDKRDARRQIGEDWELLRICGNLADGKFINNAGKTRVYLYYFAIMFGMTVKLKETDACDPETDMVKNLFEDYYCDNLIRFLDKAYSGPQYEREPAGDGINFKNFLEVIYLYYLYRTDLNLTPGERIDRAEDKIRKCVEASEDAEEGEFLTESIPEPTKQFKDMYIHKVIDFDEESLVDNVVTNYLIVFPEGGAAVSRIMLSSEENTAYGLMSEVMEDLETAYFSSAAGGQIMAGEDFGSSTDMKTFAEDTKLLDGLTFDWKLAKMLREKYADDADFIRLVDHLKERVSAEFNWIGERKKVFLIRLLHVLYRDSSEDRPIRLEKIKETLRPVCAAVNGSMISEAADILAGAGFDVRRVAGGKGGGSSFCLGARTYEDEDLNRIIRRVTGRYDVNEKAVLPLLNKVLEERAPAGGRISRSTLIAAYVSYYIMLLNDSEGESKSKIKTFPQLYEDFASELNPKLKDARFQPLSEKNIFDMYVLLSLYQYVIENRG